jgi:hypothetical protein
MAPLEIRHRSVRPISAKHAQASRFLQQSPIEEYIAVKVQEANKGIESKLTAQTWVIGSVGFVLAVIGLAPAFIKQFQ